MLFNSIIFLIFGAVFFSIWPIVNKSAGKRFIYLIVMSFIFYGWADWRYILLLLGIGILDFFMGIAIDRYPSRRTAFLSIAIIGNVGTLAVFKYALIFFRHAGFGLSMLGINFDAENDLPGIFRVLPMGISFYSLQGLGYLIDVYRGKIKPTADILHFFAFLALFPHLIAGPIVRSEKLLPQLLEKPVVSQEKRWNGFRLIVQGYFKKMVIGDNLALFVAATIGKYETIDSCLIWWGFALMFAVQLYFDFSGYSDIGRGLANWMGYEYPLNFKQPYTSTSMREFWTRWHISLSTWFRDYLYIPLGGAKVGKYRWHLNMWITMIIAGLWHGATFNFVMWGAIHAFFLSFERITKWPERIKFLKGHRIVSCILVIIQVTIAWVFFRAENMDQAFKIISSMFNFSNFSYNDTGFPFLFVGIAATWEMFYFFNIDKTRFAETSLYKYLDYVVLAAMITASVLFSGRGNVFIYACF